jgi:hypothetical protein
MLVETLLWTLHWYSNLGGVDTSEIVAFEDEMVL